MLGERVPAPQALEWGLINRVVADAELEAASAELLARLAGGPTLAYRRIKELLNRSPSPTSPTSSTPRHRAQREQGRQHRLHRGRHRIQRETAAQVLGNLSGRGAQSARERDAVARLSAAAVLRPRDLL